MNNETLLLMHRLVEKLENAPRWDEDGDKLEPVSIVTNAIWELINEENPEHTCEREPYEIRREREAAERKARGEPEHFYGTWKSTFGNGFIVLDPFAQYGQTQK